MPIGGQPLPSRDFSRLGSDERALRAQLERARSGNGDFTPPGYEHMPRQAVEFEVDGLARTGQYEPDLLGQCGAAVLRERKNR